MLDTSFIRPILRGSLHRDKVSVYRSELVKKSDGSSRTIYNAVGGLQQVSCLFQPKRSVLKVNDDGSTQMVTAPLLILDVCDIRAGDHVKVLDSVSGALHSGVVGVVVAYPSHIECDLTLEERP